MITASRGQTVLSVFLWGGRKKGQDQFSGHTRLSAFRCVNQFFDVIITRRKIKFPICPFHGGNMVASVLYLFATETVQGSLHEM